MGSDYPVRIQSMLNTDTMDTEACVEQAIRIIEAGGELVRVTAPGVKEAQNLKNIREELRRRGYTTPLSADIHFNPAAAIEAACHVEKVRINPGNFADKRATFKELSYTDEEYAGELRALREKFKAFLDVCRAHGTAVRVGTNHGSLSDRIMSRYGNTPEGMVEATMEYLRVCRDEAFDDVVISLKSSDCRVMVEAVRLLVRRMEEEGMRYPLHLGVTEAGEGEDGRVRSAVGIGTLLNEGLGDTIRVSLTEEPPVGPQNNYGQFNSRYGATPSPTDFPQGQQQPQNPWGQPYGQTPSYGQSSPYGGNGPDGQNPNQPFPGSPAAFFFDPLGGVKPDEDLDGVSASDMAKFVQANTQYYLPVFTNQKKFRRNRFNFCAFLCTGGWMLYRKQYKLGAILTAVMAGIYFLSLYCSYASEDILLRLMSQVGIDLDTMMPSSAQLMQLGSLLAQQPAWELILIFLPRVLNVVQLVIMIVTGIKANKTYRKFCTRKIQTIDANFPEPADREMQLRTQGGVNTPLAVGLMIAYMLAVYLPRLWLLI